MKTISLQKNLKTSVYAVNHIAQKNTNLPILNNILISARDGILKLVTTNLEIGITSVLRGKIEEEGAFTVDARLFSEYVSLLGGEKVSLEVVASELLVACGSYKTKIKGMSADDFPLIPSIDRTQFIKVSIDELKKSLARVVFSVSVDQSRMELSGVLFSLTGSLLTIAGTDSYRLAEKKIEVETNFSQERRLIIPARTLQELLRIISSDTGGEENVSDVFLYASDNQCLFVFGATEVVSRLIDGQYPDYQQIIPTKHQARIVVDRDEVIRAVKAAAIFSRTGVNDIIFSSSKNGLEISSSSGQSGEQSATIEAVVTGADTSITLNYRYVLDGLNAVSGSSVIFEIIDDQTPCILKDETDKDYLYIIMPIKK